MAVSGQVSTQSYPIYKISEMACRRALAGTGNWSASFMTAEIAQVCRDHLYLMQSSWAVLGVNLWCQEKIIEPVYPNQPTIALPSGTIDTLQKGVTWRTYARPSGTYTSSAGGTAANAFDNDIDTICTQTAPFGNIAVDYGTDVVVVSVGYLPGASETQSLSFDWSADGLTWTPVLRPGSTAYVDGEWVWYDIEAPFSAAWFRCSALAGTLVVRELYFGATPSEIVISRLNRDDYVGLPSKANTGTTTQFWLDRARVQPIMYLWPVPNTTFANIVVWRQRYIMDPGTAQNDADVPQRWLDAVVKGLAARMSMELPGVDLARVPILEQQAQEALNLVSSAEYDASPLNLTPNIGVYTQ